MDFVFVDMQGFKSELNAFIVKEIFILSKNLKFREIIKSPCSYQSLSPKVKREVNWLGRNYHGLSWFDGYITQEQLKKTIEPILTGKIVFVKGVEKISWIKSLCAAPMIVINLEEFGCDVSLHASSTSSVDNSDEREEKPCSKHKDLKNNKTAHCAVQNVWLMKNWLKNSSFGQNLI